LQKRFDKKVLGWIYKRLYRTFGKRHWWPAKSAVEVVAGAILTQNTAWSNVEKAIQSLEKKKLLTAERLYRLKTKNLAEAIRPSGFFNVKAKRIKNFLSYLFRRWGGNLETMFLQPTGPLRKELLAIDGLGEETVDSILLYAGGKPLFVVDAYTRRVLSRHGLLRGNERYEEIQDYFMDTLPRHAPLFNEYHALLVEVGKRYCRKSPLCTSCPLDPLPRTKRGCQDFIRAMEKKR